MVLTATYGELQQGSSWVPLCLRKLSGHPIVIPTKLVIGKVTPANQVPPVVLLMGTSGESTCGPTEGLDPGGVEPPGSTGVAQGGTRSGQEAAG